MALLAYAVSGLFSVGSQMCVKLEDCPSGQNSEDKQTGLFHRKTGCISTCYLCTGPCLEDQPPWVQTTPFRTVSQFTLSLESLWIQSPAAFSSYRFGRPVSEVEGLSRRPDVGSKPVTPREKLGAVIPSQLWYDCTEGQENGKIMSASPTHPDVGFSLFTGCIGVAWLFSRYFSEGIILYIAVDSLCLWEEYFRSLLHHHLEPEPISVSGSVGQAWLSCAFCSGPDKAAVGWSCILLRLKVFIQTICLQTLIRGLRPSAPKGSLQL